MKITFVKDCPPMPANGNTLYTAGTEADLRRGASLIELGYAIEGWGKDWRKLANVGKETAVSEPEPEPKTSVKELTLDDYTVAELKAMAKESGLSGYSTMNKAELIAELAP